MNQKKVGEKEVQFFQENGYLKMPHFFTKDEIAELGQALDKTVEEKRSRILGDDSVGGLSGGAEILFRPSSG